MLSPCIESSFPLHPPANWENRTSTWQNKAAFQTYKNSGFGKDTRSNCWKWKKKTSTLNISYQSIHSSNPIRLESQQETISLFTIMSLSLQIGPFKPLLFTIISGFLSNAERDFVLEPPGGNLISITFSGFIRMF